jgi:hypothetical protein
VPEGSRRVILRRCVDCPSLLEWVACPTGGWWAHVVHPADSHDGRPSRCSFHGTELAWEPGGPTWPTIRGRLFCRDCEVAFFEALDRLVA